MMNDRFSADLRQHLLETANEHPAVGQLAAIDERVAATTQRLPLVARLTWNPGRIGAFPSAAIRFGLVAAALALAAVAGAMLAGGSGSGPSTVFEGSWTSVDPGDGSGQTLVVGPGTTPAVYFEDGYASGAACVNDAVKRFTARGSGAISRDRLDVSFPDGGGCGLMTVELGAGGYRYDSATDTLVDDLGLTWSRALGDDRPATQAPATPTPATDAPATEVPATQTPATGAPPSAPSVVVPTAVPECIQLDGPDTYTAAVGSLSLAVTVPATADTPWNGRRDSFALRRAPCPFGGLATLEASLVDQVYADACAWAGTGIEVETAAEAAAALAAQTGHEVVVSDFEITLGGYPATQLLLSIPADFNLSACRGGMLRFWLTSESEGATVDTGWNASVFLLDVDGSVLALSASRLAGGEEEVPLTAALFSMVDSLQIER